MADEEKPIMMMATSSGYCYSDASSNESPQIYNLTAAMEIIGFPSKNLINQPINDLTTNHQTMMLSPLSWNHHHHNRLVADDPSLRGVFSGDGNARQSQGSLSLSLTSSNLSNTNLQSLELRQNTHRNMMLQQQFQIRNSKYLGPAKEILNQLCNLGAAASSKIKNGESPLQDDRAQPPPFALDLLELQRRKTKLFQMLQEVEGRYKHYCDQMKAVASSFEAVAGDGAAAAYSTMASREMSRLFRRLKDGIMSQIKGLGDKEAAIPGATKGETPRLRILDVKLRQQRAFQQMGMVENHPWRPQRGLPEKAVAVLRAWLFEHFLHPYPSEVDKRILARQTGLSRSQVSNWFINARVRLWKPMVEEMYLEDQKEGEGPSSGGATADLDGSSDQIPTASEDQKPTQDQLMMRTDSECLSSIINTPRKINTTVHHQTDGFNRSGDEMGAMQFDFSSYSHHGGGAVSYLHDGAAPSSYGGGGVSLTLGLQQHHGGGGGVSLAFNPAATGSSLYYPRDEMEDCETVEYSLFESENQNLQYRNLMGAQLLHDLAG